MRTIGVIFLSLFYAVLAAAESRVWTDTTGQFKIEAEFVRVDDGKVVLKKEDDKTQKIPLEKLSKKDQDYVAKQAENPFEENPFQEEDDEESSNDSKKTKNAGKEKVETSNIFSAKPKQVDVDSGGSLGAAATSTWKVPADPSPLLKDGKKLQRVPVNKLRSVQFTYPQFSSTQHDERISIFDWGGKPGAMYAFWVEIEEKRSRSDSREKQLTDSTSFVFFGDLGTGKKTVAKFPQKLEAYDVSPDGSKALFGKGEWLGFAKGKPKLLYIQKIDNGRMSFMGAYKPFDAESRFSDRDDDIKGAVWIDNDCFIVWATEGVLAMNANTGEVLWHDASMLLGSPAISPGGQYALMSKGETYLYDAKSGECFGKLENPRDYARSYFFSPDGMKIASYSENTLTVWDAQTGKITDSLFVAADMRGHQYANWIDNRYILVGGNLYDMEQQVPIWRYNFFGIDRYYGGYVFLLGRGHNASNLAAFSLPHPPALAIEKATDSQRFVVRPGMEIALKIDVSVRDGKAEIEKRMADAIKKNGFILRGDAETVLLLKVTKDKPEKVSYVTGRGFLPPSPLRGGGTEISYTPNKYWITIQKGNKTLWEQTETQRPPSNISLDEMAKSSLQDIVNREMNKPGYKEWFLKADIPKKVTNPDIIIGASTVRTDGIKDGTTTVPLNKPKTEPTEKERSPGRFRPGMN
jgi:WD40 repeat protein